MEIAIFPAWIADHQWLSLFLLQGIKIFSQFCGFVWFHMLLSLKKTP